MEFFRSIYENPHWGLISIISALITLCLPILLDRWFFRIDLSRLPKIASRRIPVLGHSYSFYRDPLGLIRSNDWENGGVFILHLAGRKIVVICDPKLKKLFYNEKNDNVLSHSAALASFEFAAGQRLHSNDRLLRIVQSKLIKSNISNLILRESTDFSIILFREMRQQLHAAESHVPDILTFSKKVAMNAVATFYIGQHQDMSTIFPELFAEKDTFSMALMASMILPRWVSSYLMSRAQSKRQNQIDKMTKIIEHVIETGGTKFLPSFIDRVNAKLQKANRGPATSSEIADLVYGQITSAAMAPALVFYQMLVFILSSPYRDDLLAVLKNEVSSVPRTDIQKDQALPLLTCCIWETLRLISHTIGSMRLAVSPFFLGRYVIPEGYYVAVSNVATCYNDEIFQDCTRFDPYRWKSLDVDELHKEGKFTPFSGGSHKCPGQKLAIFIVKAMMMAFLLNVNSQRLAVGPSPLPALNWTRPALAGRNGTCTLDFEYDDDDDDDETMPENDRGTIVEPVDFRE